MNSKEDRVAPVDCHQVYTSIESGKSELKQLIINEILNQLDEKRDAYHGIINSIIYVVDSSDSCLICLLEDGLIDFIANNPMKYGGKVFLSKVLHRLIPQRPNFVINLFEKLIRTTDIWSNKHSTRSEILRLQIIALKSIKRAELESRNISTTLNEELIDQLCNDAMLKGDDSTKIDTLCLILESRSTTKVIELQELVSFKLFLPDALSLQEPSLRQTFLALTNKFLKRLRDSHKLVIRDKIRFSDCYRKAVSDRYMSFLTWLVDSCFNSIYCNAYFGSFIITMSILKLIIENITFHDKDLPVEGFFSKPRCYDSLLSCLNDSFEENKTLAMNLLFSLPKNELFINEKNLKQFECIALNLVNSVNPAHSLTCHYIFRLVIGLRLKQTAISQTKNNLILRYLTKLLVLVEEGVADTRENLIVAIKYNAIYPKLTCMRALLNEIDVHNLEPDRDEWTNLSSRIVKASLEACQAVSTIVCNLNPETIGHLPMDQKPINVDALSKSLNISLNISSNQLQTITSQMLLISGWKTIKECSLSMGTLCTHLWWPKEKVRGKKIKFSSSNSKPILSSEDIRRIITFFDHYLRNLRHRGAFEQAYNGFIMVTERIWPDEELRNLLIETLKGIMKDFRGREEQLDDKKIECLKAYVTRRSAGLPFIVQAIVNSEHKHDSTTLRWVMNCLFEILDDDNAETYQKIHCLNILKALIRQSDLGEKVIPFIGKTLSITMKSFKSDIFPIRNCANMLLKATVDRTFGVNRLREDIHRRNKLSWLKFFSECPGLDAEMLEHLNESVLDRRCLAVVHSVFIILSRLKPKLSANEEIDSETTIRPFIQPVEELTFTCPDYKLRELAAKLAVQFRIYCNDLEEISNFESYLEGLTTSAVECASENNRNRLHGVLLLFKNWIDALKLPGQMEYQEMVLKTAKQVIESVLFNQGNDTPVSDNTIKLVALDVAEMFCLVRPESKQYWLSPLFPMLNNLISLGRHQSNHLKECHFEQLIFKCVSILLMSHCFEYQTPGQSDLSPELLFNIIISLIIQPSDRIFSVNLQAALLRLIRQLAKDEREDFIDCLLDDLDIDSTAAHMTPFDRLKLMRENDSEREIWINYCKQIELRKWVRESSQSFMDKLFDLRQFSEFVSPNLSFLPKTSNSPRAIELLALIYQCWSQFNVFQSTIWQAVDEPPIVKLKFITRFTSSMPDCDIKCLAILCATKLFNINLSNLEATKSKQSIEVLEAFTQLLEELADGHHNFLVRETCSKSLELCLGDILQKRSTSLQSCIVNLLSTLIKLYQDEEHGIRQCSYRIINNLRDNIGHARSVPSSAGRLNNLISLITGELFDGKQERDVINCFQLSTRIIFNHTKNFSTTLNDQREVLFDKTKLNTFADHVAIIESCLNGLEMFLQENGLDNGLDVSCLQISNEVLVELDAVYVSATDRDTDGDYNWRLKKCVGDNLKANDNANFDSKQDGSCLDVDKILDNILKSLNYFSNGYWNMLTDTDYPYHELSLFKRVAFVKFVLKCTNHKLHDKNRIAHIKNRIDDIVKGACSTTMLCKCQTLLSDL